MTWILHWWKAVLDGASRAVKPSPADFGGSAIGRFSWNYCAARGLPI